MSKPLREHYIIFKGDDIKGECNTLQAARDIYDALPPKERRIDGRAIYKLVKEE